MAPGWTSSWLPRVTAALQQMCALDWLCYVSGTMLGCSVLYIHLSLLSEGTTCETCTEAHGEAVV